MTSKRITSTEVYAAFEDLCTALHVVNASNSAINGITGNYLMIDSASDTTGDAKRRYYVSGMIGGSSVNYGFVGAREALATLQLMTRAAWWAKRLL